MMLLSIKSYVRECEVQPNSVWKLVDRDLQPVWESANMVNRNKSLRVREDKEVQW